jgi:two-component system CheB/CheR fusion protein
VKEYIDQNSQDTIDDGRIVEDGGELPMPRPLGAAFPGAAIAGAAFPIVGVGASAGGLDAFTQLLKHLPTDTGMGFVLIQHLDPTHTSFLRDALAKATTMAVHQAEDGTAVEPDHVYVIPPDADMSIHGGRLTLASRALEARRSHLSVDGFLRSLAADRGSHAIGVVLSGNASDGTEGLRAIKAENGITLAQDPESAKYGEMPRNAVNAGVVDYALAIPDLAGELVRLSRHPYVAAVESPPAAADAEVRNQILSVVRTALGVDFGEYKLATVQRRLARRMALRRVQDEPAYLALLQRDPAEIRALYEDILIHVTSFFRDPALFDALESHILPAVLKQKPEGTPLRIWVAGCSTGEEVYSIAISVLEVLGDSRRPVQIFGSDLSEPIIARARAGVYPDAALRDISEDRRRRYFAKTERGYRINKAVRDMCVFVQHDLARDPPLSKLDLVSCRNVLIYFDQALQKRVIPGFHYALNQPGYLLLGHTESISGFGQLFSVADKANKIFARTAHPSLLRFAPRFDPRRVERPVADPDPRVQVRGRVDVTKHLDRMLLARYAPPGVLINERMQILQFRGQTGSFLQPAPGDPQNDIIKMARPGLVSVLRAALAEAKKEMAPARRNAVEIDQDGFTRRCNLVVLPFTGYPDVHEPLFVVLFEDEVASDRWRRVRRRCQTARFRTVGGRPPVSEARTRAPGDEGVSAIPHRGARANQRRSGLGQRGAGVRERRAPEHERGARDREGGAAVDERRADDGQRRATEPQSGGHAGEQRPAEPARHRGHSDRHSRSRAPDPPLHAQGAEHPQRRPDGRRAGARRHQAERRGSRSRSAGRRRHRHDGADGVRGAGPARALVPDADPPLQGHGQ